MSNSGASNSVRTAVQSHSQEYAASFSDVTIRLNVTESR